MKVKVCRSSSKIFMLSMLFTVWTFLSISTFLSPNMQNGFSVTKERIHRKTNQRLKYKNNYEEYAIKNDTQNEEAFNYLKNYKPWPDDPICSKFITKFGKNLPLVYLVSFPRSGNTWVRYLLEGATGIFTGTIYNDTDLYKLGFLGEKEPHKSGRVIIVKTHRLPLPDSKYIEDDTPTIVVIRNLKESLTSFWSYSQHKDLFEKNNPRTFESSDFHSHTVKHINHWQRIYEDLLLWSRNILIIFYEHLLKDPIKEVKEILKFLEFPFQEERIRCLQNNFNGKAKRAKVHINPFSEEEKSQMEKALASVVYLLKLRGIKNIPEEYNHIIE
ncbi:UNVERIFIED_CONTAM: hypothetical protein RMT77_004939 [Armadillidium vulgare]